MIDFGFKKGGHPGRDRPSKMVVWNEGFALPRLIKFYHNKKISQRESYKYLKFQLIMWVRILESEQPTGCIGHKEQ
jgi:hypothetical protein